MQPLGRDFLLTLTNTELSLWHVPHGLCLATFDAPRAFGLAAALDSSTGSDAIACVLGTKYVCYFYPSPPPELIKQFLRNCISHWAPGWQERALLGQ